MDWNAFFGIAALVTSITMSCVGLPAQIWKNYQRKSTEGLSLMFNFFLFINIASWLGYGLSMSPPNAVMIIANTFAASLLALLLIQFVLYRKGAKTRSADIDS